MSSAPHAPPGDSTAAAAARACRNCGEPLRGRYCADCGQEDALDLPFGRMAADFLADVFNLDSRLWRTLRLLLTRPGRLSVEWRDGRRERYLPPARLYVAVSVLFFALVALSPLQLVHIEVTLRDNAAPAEAGFSALLARGATEIERVNQLFVRSLAWAMFVLIPVFALLLKVLFRGRGMLYVHHVVFTLHYHAFGFAWLAVAFAASHLDRTVGSVPVPVYFLIAALAVNAGYLYLAARRFYGDGPVRILAKFAALGFAYLSAVAVVMMATAAVAVLLL